ncbi:MAG: hypothetical protein BMS9Abin39_1048 [Ignavibacteria bacterium]|nr:MAG: hypothetical protein BMS9Abin39_1048 [Ignavibacteria bacterium]
MEFINSILVIITTINTLLLAIGFYFYFYIVQFSATFRLGEIEILNKN